jgi:hypothetical protein
MRGSFALCTMIALAAAALGRAPAALAQATASPMSSTQLASAQTATAQTASPQTGSAQTASPPTGTAQTASPPTGTAQTAGGTIVWHTVDRHEHGTALAVGDVHRAFPSGTYGFWQKIVSPEGSYSVRLVETDCANARERDIIVVRYSPAPERALAEYSTDPSRWRPVLPATLGDSAFHDECRSVGHPAP